MRFMFLILGLSLSLSATAASSLQNTSYKTGAAVTKPMVMTGYVELSQARSIADIAFTDLDGSPKRIADHKGKLVVLNLWASWCAPCLREMPALKVLQQNLKDQPIEIVPLSLDDDPKLIPAFLARHGLEGYESWFDPTLKVEGIMPANVVPATYVFDGEGHLVGFVRGFVDWADKDSEAFLVSLAQKYTGESLKQLLSQ